MAMPRQGRDSKGRSGGQEREVGAVIVAGVGGLLWLLVVHSTWVARHAYPASTVLTPATQVPPPRRAL